jgi:hypothetical protein
MFPQRRDSKLKHNSLLSVLLGVFLCLSNPSLIYAMDLNGKTFIGPKGEVGEVSDGTEEVQFSDNQLYSASSAEWGFGKGDLTTEMKGDTLHFKATTTSPDHGKIEWKGTVKGDTIDAKFVWTKERWWWADGHKESWFKGTLQ